MRDRLGSVRFIGRRALYAILQIFGVVLITFVMVRLLPANPAQAILGPYATPDGIAKLEERMGLDKPIWIQFVMYMGDLVQADLGRSWLTSSPVLSDLARRFPATLELLLISMGIATILGISVGTLVASGGSQLVRRIVSVYALIAGALPEFWVGLLLIYFFFVRWHLPALVATPSGQIDFVLTEPRRITGMIVVDSLLTGSWEVFLSSLRHLVLPVTTLVIVLTGPILKVTRSKVGELMHSDFVWFLRACGYPPTLVMRRTLFNALPVIIAQVATLFAYMLGGAVVVETVFSWGGFGQYAVSATQHADLMAIQGTVLVAGVFTVLIYVLLDLLSGAIDPRIATGR